MYIYLQDRYSLHKGLQLSNSSGRLHLTLQYSMMDSIVKHWLNMKHDSWQNEVTSFRSQK